MIVKYISALFDGKRKQNCVKNSAMRGRNINSLFVIKGNESGDCKYLLKALKNHSFKWISGLNEMNVMWCGFVLFGSEVKAQESGKVAEIILDLCIHSESSIRWLSSSRFIRQYLTLGSIKSYHCMIQFWNSVISVKKENHEKISSFFHIN